ncbi:Copine [Cynara cardunculus var. scolymus]|uniref:Copine n=1 Tax=Cynara cardunculus var. scolymus TaxID=59895 RepID=A0A118JRT6_CYNCS|nr:Copine [Cynara cardunculus var. scolymus]
MGNILSQIRGHIAARKRPSPPQPSQPPPPPPPPNLSLVLNPKGPSRSGSRKSRNGSKNKYAYIPDNYSSLEQVTQALRESGLDLHAIGDFPNPYEKAISIIGQTLAPFDDDNLIPCFGFGDGPTSYAAVVNAAMDIVEKSGGQFHILVIIADGQVTRSINTSDGDVSLQEQKTISSIVEASLYPLVIVLVGVGDGPWDDMRKFDDKIPTRGFDNFQFVNFTGIMSKDSSPPHKEAAFALAALMEIPIQYTAVTELGLLGRVTTNRKRITPRQPPRPRGHAHVPQGITNPTSTENDENKTCPICLTNDKDMAFGCGHMACRECGSRLSRCHICRQEISSRIRLYTG